MRDLTLSEVDPRTGDGTGRATFPSLSEVSPAWHWIHSDDPSDADPWRPGRYCGPHCDLYEPPLTESELRLLDGNR